MSGFGFGVGGFADTFSCGGKEPVWDHPCFKDLTLGNSLSGGAASKEAPSRANMQSLVDALSLVTAQLYSLSSRAPAGRVRKAAGMAHSAFMRSMELCRALPKVTDHQSFYELLTSFVARVKALTPGAVLVMPAGWKGGLVTLVLHCASFDSFTLAVCSVGDGLLYHAVRVDPGSGAMQYNSPLLVRDIPAHRIRDGAFWFVALKAALFPDSKHSAALFYEQLLPYLNQRPLASNVSAGSSSAVVNGSRPSGAYHHAPSPSSDMSQSA